MSVKKRLRGSNQCSTGSIGYRSSTSIIKALNSVWSAWLEAHSLCFYTRPRCLGFVSSFLAVITTSGAAICCGLTSSTASAYYYSDYTCYTGYTGYSGYTSDSGSAAGVYSGVCAGAWMSSFFASAGACPHLHWTDKSRNCCYKSAIWLFKASTKPNSSKTRSAGNCAFWPLESVIINESLRCIDSGPSTPRWTSRVNTPPTRWDCFVTLFIFILNTFRTAQEHTNKTRRKKRLLAPQRLTFDTERDTFA